MRDDTVDRSNAAVAVIGIGCRFPGGVVDPASFWKLLVEGRDAIGEIPASRIDLGHYFDPRPRTPGRMMTRWGGFLDGIEAFDAEFFGISPREAERIDPQQRLLLETAWEALEDAALDVHALDGHPVGVFVGQWLSDFESRLFADPEAMQFDMTTGSGRYASSGRISYALGLRGASLTLDTGCSSSLVAVHLAVQSVRSGESELALAGGVNVILQPHISIAYSQSGMMASDGRCKFGDARGDGYVRSEGAGVVVLKRLDRALRDGDRIYAVIRGSAVNNDGSSSGSMGTPSAIGQKELLRSALQDAGVAGGALGYVEAHGTGTRAGDPVEIGALGTVLAEERADDTRCLIGSVKTNIGHTEGAAGIAGLIKATLALHHGVVPPTMNVRQPNPAVPWATLPLELPLAARAWPRGVRPRLAGVNSFGIAGTNAHVVLEEAPLATAYGPDAARPCLLPLSARSVDALVALAELHAQALATDRQVSLADWCRAASCRAAHEVRATFVAADAAAMIEALRRDPGGEARPIAAAGAKLAFIIPGQGAQSLGMARELMRTEPVFLAAIRRCDLAAREYVDWSIEEQLTGKPGAFEVPLERIDVLQPVLVALALAYAALLETWGLIPDMVVGHSMGEVGAACIARALSVEQAMQIVCRRSQLMRRTSGQGAMALVELSAEQLGERLCGHEHEVSLAVCNSPRSSVISGAPQAVKAIMRSLEAEQIFCRKVNVDVASHSPAMDPLVDELVRDLASLQPQGTCCALYSSVLARAVAGSELDAAYWGWNLRRPVRFGETVQAMIADGAAWFVELGPHPVLLPAVEQNAGAAGCAVSTVACGRRGEPEQAGLLAAAGALWAAGASIDWRGLMPAGGRSDRLPAYPWQRQRHWAVAAERPASGAGAGHMQKRPDDESLAWLHTFEWRPREITSGRAGAGRWLVAGADLQAAQALGAALNEAGAESSVVSLAALEDALGGPPFDHLALMPGDDADAAFAPLAAAQALAARSAHAAARLWLITRGAQAVAVDERVSALQAAAWGAARVIAGEHPERRGGLVDLPAAEAVDWRLLAGHLCAFDGEDQVALRGARRFVLRLAPLPGPLTAAFAWRPDASYLLTGGLGGVGLHVARVMVAGGARRLVLLGRTPLPARHCWAALDPADPAAERVAAVRALEALGAAVHVEAVDVADEAALRAFLSRYEAQGWPRIRGVIHAVGAFDNRLVAAMDRHAFDAVMAPKIRGAKLLDRLLPDLDLFVLFSSTGAFMAQAGQANYAAANAGLDAVARDRRGRGLPALSIGWGIWADTGLVRNEAGRHNVEEMGRQGIGALSPDQAAALFPWLCARPEAHLAVLAMDWPAFARAAGGRLAPLFEAFAAAAGATSRDRAEGSEAAAPAPAERKSRVRAAVIDAVGKVLRIPAARLDPHKAFGAMGLNSLMAMELRNRLEAALARPLSATLAWNYPTVEALAEHLLGQPAPQEPTPPPVHAAVPLAAAVESLQSHPAPHLARPAKVAQLSDAEAAMALRGTRRRGAA